MAVGEQSISIDLAGYTGDIRPGVDLSGADLRDADLPRVNLRRATLSGANFRDTDLSGADLRGADLPRVDLRRATLSGANLSSADLSGAYLSGADLSKVDLNGANLSGAHLRRTNLSEANLFDAELSKARLFGADLSGANLRDADLSGANLRDADLSSTDLRNANLSKTNLCEVTIANASLSRGTNITSPGERIHQFYANKTRSKNNYYDLIARINNELREAYSANGLISQAREARFRERKARRDEARAERGWGFVAYAGSVLSMIFTGYGVRLRWVIASMLALYIGSAFVYWHWGEMWWGQSLYYSIVTFTTAPPEAPPNRITSVVAGIETFAGTAAIVFLGYVLGTRESV